MTGLGVPPKLDVRNVSALADFVEIECLRRADRNVSTTDLVRITLRGDDPSELPEGTAQDRSYEVFSEFSNRHHDCGTADGRYPYRPDESGALVEFQPGSESNSGLVYLFLLFATKLNMKSDRLHGGHDGTAIFEQLSREVALRLWGGPEQHVEATVFGTGREASELKDSETVDSTKFETAIQSLCRELGEGDGFRAPNDGRVTARDGKLDIVVWRRFADRREGQLVGFGQCKTGTHWKGELTKLRPENFCKKFMLSHPAVDPVRLFFVADRVARDWRNACIEGGLLLDRCRIVELARDLPDELLEKMRSWVHDAARKYGLELT